MGRIESVFGRTQAMKNDEPTIPLTPPGALRAPKLGPKNARSPSSSPGAPDPTFRTGDVVADRYTVTRFIDRGGMGEVFEVVDEELRVNVALKTILRKFAADDTQLARFKKEVLLARSIVHPGICRIFDLGRHRTEDGVVVFLTMELLLGESLSSRIDLLKRIPEPAALSILKQMAQALDAAHASGVVHRDFKSGNVLLVPGAGNERVVLTDFGLARGIADSEAELTAAGNIIGSPGYMAPEQVVGEAVGPAADIYALGVVLYEMLTGRLPFVGRTALETAAMRVTEVPEPPRRLVSSLSIVWETAILKCLERVPGDRFACGADIVKYLEGEGRRQKGAGSPSVEEASQRVPAATVAGAQKAGMERHALPAERDAFVGRTAEVAQLTERLASGQRLVTVLGPAGTGKTRLVQHFAWTRLADWPGGIWFCDLSEVKTQEGIATALAARLSVFLGKQDPITLLGHAMAGRGRALFILDNFEQVVEHAETTVGAWLEIISKGAILVTSRERLHIAGEEVMPVDPLDVSRSAVELFTVRANAQNPDFELTDENKAAVGEVVRWLDGLPLAVELAAARARVLSPEQLLARLKDRFRLLTSGAAKAAGRHATLRAALDWSWELLEPWEQAGLAQCSVFEGPFTLEAAEAIVDLSAWPEAPWVIDIVQGLLDKSMLRIWRTAAPGEVVLPQPCFAMLLSIREYASEKLRDERERTAALIRHGRFFAGFGSEDALEALYRHGGTARCRALEVQLDNLAAACRRAVARGDGHSAVATWRAAWAVYQNRGPFSAAVDLGRQVLAMTTLERKDRADALLTLGLCLQKAGMMDEAREQLDAALVLYREVGDRKSEGVALGSLGELLRQMDRVDEARETIEAALHIHRELGNSRGEGIALINLGAAHFIEGRPDEAMSALETALQIHREWGDRRNEGLALIGLGNLHNAQGRFEEGCRYYEAARGIHREVGDRRNEGAALLNQGSIYVQQGRFDEAREYLDATLRCARELGDRQNEGIALVNLGVVHYYQGRLDEACRHYEAALPILAELGDRRSESSVVINLGTLYCQQGRYGESREHLEAALRIHRELADPRNEGIALGNLGILHASEDRPDEALQHFEAALEIQRELGNRDLEAAVLGDLGNLLRDQGRMEEAKRKYEAALAIHRDQGNRRGEGVLLSNLALWNVRQGRLNEARGALDQSEALLREQGDGFELGTLLCHRAWCERMAGNLDEARRVLAEASSAAHEVTGPESTLGREIEKLRKALAD